jgi:hypothetical protein
LISKKIEVLLVVSVNICTVLTAFYIGNNVNYPGYENLFLLPLIFGILYALFLSPIRRALNNIFIHVFIVISFTRFVVLPFLIVQTSYYGGRSSAPPQIESFENAINLMIYELIVVSIFIFILFKNYKSSSLKTLPPKLPQNYLIYVLFICTSLALGLIFPESFKSFGFLSVPLDLAGVGESSIIISLITYSLVISKFLLFVLILGLLYNKYLKTNNNIFVILSFFVLVLNISIFFGGNRADFIITTIAALLLFYKLYPIAIKYTILPIVVIFVFILGSLNDFRANTSVTNGANTLMDLTGNLQIYLAGPYNVAIAIEAAKLYQSEPLHLVHELLRPVIGLNIFLKNLDIEPSSTFFNERIFFSDQVTQIIPMIGQGYFYLGFLFAPLIALLFLYLVKMLISYRDTHFRIELIFFFSISIARLGFLTVQNGSILANDTSFFLLLFLFVFYLNNRIVLKKKYTPLQN